MREQFIKVQYGDTEDQFVEWIRKRIPSYHCNYETIVRLNEIGMPPDQDPLQLEAGANHCAI